MTRSDYTDYTPFQQIGTAWNILMNVKGDLPKEHYSKIISIMAELDTILMDLHPKGKVAPLPFNDLGLEALKDHHDGQ